MSRLYLASTSPRRQELLAGLGLPFEILEPGPEEAAGGWKRPSTLVRRLAEVKARGATGQVEAGLIIAADTLVFLDGQPLGKPHTAERAIAMLTALSGRTHLVRTGVALLELPSGHLVSGVSTTRVRFRDLGRDEILAYVGTNEPLDKAGGYGVQGKGGLLVAGIAGSYSNVIGLPLELLGELFRRLELDLWAWIH